MFVSRAPVIAGLVMIAAASAVGLGAAVAAADDSSNYDGTKCAADQFYNATDQGCESAVVSNDPDGVPQPQDVGANYDGTKCDAGQFFNGSQQSCVPTAVTNDAQTEQRIANGDPLDFTMPTPVPDPKAAQPSRTSPPGQSS